MELISVIVPVYKVEPYLDRCVQSIVDQTYQNLEIILVDDGSPDNCPAMCDAWAEKDSRIKVIHKKNGGGAQARNVGLDASSGDLIAFVDSDDYIGSDMLTFLVQLLNSEPNIDIAECGYVDVLDDNYKFEPEHKPDISIFPPEEALRLHIEDSAFRQLIWNKLYRRHCVDSVRFTEGKKIDDEFFTYLTLGKARRLIRSSQVFYAYRQQSGSIMHQSFSPYRLQAIEAKYARLKYLQQHFPSLVSDAITDLLFTCMYMGQMSLKYLAASDCSAALSKIESYFYLFSKHSMPPNASFKSKAWIALANISFIHTCKFRNSMKIGC